MKVIVLFCLIVFLLQCTPPKVNSSLFNLSAANSALDLATDQYLSMILLVPDSLFPRNIEPYGSIKFVEAWDWTSGFYPGTLWYLYEYSDNTILQKEAKRKSELIASQKHNGSTHDLGFMLYCSLGNGLRIDSVSTYNDILLTGAETLAGRFNETIGCIKSWDWAQQWQFPVIVDNMMNLEYLFWAFNITNDSTYFNKAVSHADKTILNHYRPDFSSYHVVNYDTLTGKILEKVTLQGYSDDSHWARGQAWGLYGFTMMYRETKTIKYLEHAQQIAAFILSHPNLPSDMIPYWDLSDPGIPKSPRDASAAAIIASALLELHLYSDEHLSEEYIIKAEKILHSLSSPSYCSKTGENNYFILDHSVGHLPGGTEIDTSINYADYYYIEALLRYRMIKKIGY